MERESLLDSRLSAAPQPFAIRWIQQFTALWKKNNAVLAYMWKSSLLFVLLPSAFVIGLYYLVTSLSGLDTSLQPMHLQSCTSFDIDSLPYEPATKCITVAYAAAEGSDPAFVDSIMASIAASSNLQLGSDIMKFGSGAEMAGWMFDHSSQQVDAAVVITATRAGQAEYEIWTNATLPAAYQSSGLDAIWRYSGYSGRLLALQVALEGAIVEQTVAAAAGKAVSLSLDATIAPFEEVSPLSGGVSDPTSVAQYVYGPAFLSIGVVGASLLVLVQVSGEKHRKLLGMLKTVGLLDSAYWASWFVSYLPLILAAAVLTPASGAVSKLIIFARVDFSIHMLAILLLGTATVAMALALSACVSRPVWVTGLAFVQFALSVSLTIIFGVIGLYQFAYLPTIPPGLAFLFIIWPYFHYGRLLSSAMRYILTGGSSLNADSASSSPFSGDNNVATFGWTQLQQTPPEQTIYVSGLPRQWTDKPASYDLGMLCVLTLVYMLLAWYFSSVSTGAPVYFFLLPSYWGLVKPASKQAMPADGDTLAQIQQASATEGSIRVHKLSKSYKQVQALKEVTLHLKPNAVTALLGQNGAGKSTLIGLLSGLTEPTHGAAYALGLNIATEIGTLRSVMGSCPQDDLLYEELSPHGHLSLFGALKGLYGPALEKHVQEQLELVALGKEAFNAVATFSGGMKRRLSVAISSIGAPKILFLDEPTTGLDPLSRRQVWDIIQTLKVGRILLLTSHLMEEADSLADEVAVLAGGRLRAVGTPLFLKASFGSGYSINIMAHPARLPAVRALIQAHLQGAAVVGDLAAAVAQSTSAVQPGLPGQPTQAFSGSGNGSLTVSVPYTSLHLIPPFLRLLDSMSEGTEGGKGGVDTGGEDDGRIVREWGISLSSLEEVFLRLASREHEVNSGAAGSGSREAGLGLSMGGSEGQGVGGGALTVSADSRRLCALCEAAPTARVSVYNSKGIAVTSSDLFCLECADRDSSALAVVKETLAAQRAALVASLKAGGAVPLALMDQPGGVSPRTAVEQEPVGAALAPAVAGAPSADNAEVQVDPGMEPATVPPALPAALWAADRSAKSNDMTQSQSGPHKPVASGPPPPVSFFVQFLAVLRLQLRLSAPAKYTCRGIICSSFCANICLVMVAIIITVATAGRAGNVNLTQCSPGFWTNNRTGLCDRDVYIDYMTGAVGRTNLASQAWYAPAPVDSDRGVSSMREAKKRSKGSTSAEAPGLTDDGALSTAVLLYKVFCPDPDDSTAPACFLSGGVAYNAPDFTALTDTFQAAVGREGMYPLPVLGYADKAARSAADPSFLPFTALNLLEGLESASVLSTPMIHRLDVTTAPVYGSGLSGFADANAFLRAVQNTVREGEKPINSSCYSPDQARQGVQYAYPVADVLAFQNSSLLASGVTFRRLAPGGTGASAGQGIALAYDVRVPALQGYSSSVYRGNNYYFLAGVNTHPTYCDYVARQLLEDNLLDGPARGYPEGADSYTGRAGYVLVNMIHGAFLRAALAAVGAPAAASAFIHGAFVPMPDVQYVPGQGYAPPSPYQTLVWPLFTMTVLPGIVSAVATERTEKLWAMMSMSGVRRAPYIAAHLATGALMYLPIGGTYVLVGALAGASSFIFPSPGLLVLLLLLWAFAQAGWGILLGTLIPSPRYGAILSYLLAVGIALANLLITANYTPWPQNLTWIPFLSYARASSLVLTASGVPGGSKATEMWTALGITFMQGLLALLLGAYLHAVLPMSEQTGVPEHPLFPVFAAMRWWQGRGRGSARAAGGGGRRVAHPHGEHALEGSGPDASPLMGGDSLAVRVGQARSSGQFKLEGGGADGEEGEDRGSAPLDVDVAAEAAWAEEAAITHNSSGQVSSSAAILLYHLRKLYWPGMSKQAYALLTRTPPPAPKQAVRGVSLAVRYGQTLGLLGPNGAGKSTIISMLTGTSTPTSGSAWVAGCDVASDLPSAWRRLGVCPQVCTPLTPRHVSCSLTLLSVCRAPAAV